MTAKMIKFSGFAVVPELKNGIVISSNNIIFSEKELKNFASSLINKPILTDRSNKTRDIIGKIIFSDWSKELNGIVYHGWIKDKQINEMIEDKRITGIRINAIIKELVKLKKNYKLALGIQGLAFFTVSVPEANGSHILTDIFEDIGDIEEEFDFNKEWEKFKKEPLKFKIEVLADTIHYFKSKGGGKWNQ